MLKLLINHWLLQKKRNFKWKNFFLFTYFYVLILGSLTVGAIVAQEELHQMLGGVDWTMVLAVAGVAVAGFDLVMKYFFKDDPVLMPAYFKTRPVDDASWHWFVVISNVFDIFTIGWVVPLVIIAFSLLSPWVAMGYGAIFLLLSLTNSMFISAMHKVNRWVDRLPTLAMWIIYWVVSAAYAVNFFALPVLPFVLGFCGLAAVALVTITKYMTTLRGYNESKSHTERVKGNSLSTLYALEFRPFLRSPRFRFLWILLLLLAASNYMHGSTYAENGQDISLLDNFIFGIIILPIVYLQNTLSVIGNYIEGMWTRPFDVAQLFRRQYYCSVLLAIVSTAIVLPTHFIFGIPLAFIGSLFLLIVGFCNLLMMLYVFLAKRMDLFDKSMFNQQGANFSAQAFGLTFAVLLLPMVLIAFLDATILYWLFTGVGLLGVALHRPILAAIAKHYEKNRHKYFETYRQ